MSDAKHYDHLKIEPKWQNYWKKHKTFKAEQNSDKPSFYALDMFPFPSGAGLHVGHPVGYLATDITSRKKRQQGINVLHPMGWDAFGLPAENYAIKSGVHPKKSTYENISNFQRQIKSLGLSYDWSREFSTTDPDYYKWTQWLFLKFYKEGLLYEDKKPMNWCPSCKVVCANEEVESGMHERCGNEVEKKALRQWMFEITKYADRLLADLDKPTIAILHGWEANSQSNWFVNAALRLRSGTDDVTDKENKNGLEVMVPDFPNTCHPVYEEWAAHFEKEVKPKLLRNSVLIGHSLGGGFLQKYLSENDLKVGEIILVAPTVTDCGVPELANFFTADFDYEKIKNSADNIFIYASTNDNYIKNSEIDFLTKKLDAKTTILENRDHLMEPEFPELFVHLEKNILGSVLDWPEKIRAMQKNWLGKSEGIEIEYEIDGFTDEKVVCYTTRPDTNFGATFLVLAPEHEFLVKNLDKFPEENRTDVAKYIKEAGAKSDIDRMAEGKKKTGVFTGLYVLSNLTGKKLPLYVGDFVLAHVGTGAVIGVPGHDRRDFEFAQAMGNIDIMRVVVAPDGDTSKITSLEQVQEKSEIMINSEFLDGLPIMEAKEKIMDFMVEKGFGKKVTNYRLRDWIFTRQRYWGEPIPLIHCDDCGVVPHDKEFAKYERTKKEACKSVISKVTATASLSPNILASRSVSVKKSKIKTSEIPEKGSILSPTLGEISWDKNELYAHFSKKFLPERRFRWGLIPTVLDALPQIDLWIEDSQGGLAGYFHDRKNIFCVVIKDGKLLTLYHSQNLSKTWKNLKKNYSLPLVLPETANYEPSASGESPLAKITDWVNTTCPTCDKPAKRETSTMPNWAGSNWYWLRFMDPKNSGEFMSWEAEKQWGPVDLYVGGAEHAVLHLLYSRFWHKALYDMGLVSTKEPFKKLVNQGLILAEGGVKMSKSLGNVVNPDDIVTSHGADTLRVYEMFMGPFEQAKPWDNGAVGGSRKFLDRIWRFMTSVDFVAETDSELLPTIHQTIKLVSEHIDDFKFNTAIAQLMICFNTLGKNPRISEEDARKVIILVSPFAPHLAEEIWREIFGEKSSINDAIWPNFEEKYLVEDSITYGIQVNGKVRGELTIGKDVGKEEVLSQAKAVEKIQKYLEEGEIRKEIFVPGKIIGFVVK